MANEDTEKSPLPELGVSGGNDDVSEGADVVVDPSSMESSLVEEPSPAEELPEETTPAPRHGRHFVDKGDEAESGDGAATASTYAADADVYAAALAALEEDDAEAGEIPAHDETGTENVGADDGTGGQEERVEGADDAPEGVDEPATEQAVDSMPADAVAWLDDASPAEDVSPTVEETVIAEQPLVAPIAAPSAEPSAAPSSTMLLDAEPTPDDIQAAYAQSSRPKGGRIALIVTLSIVGVLVAAYFAGVFVFTSRFFPRTTINGEDVSLAAVDDVAAAHSRATDGYVLKVSGEGLDFTLSGADLKLHIDGEGFAKWAHDQMNPWAWPLELFGEHELDAEEVTTFDEAALKSAVSGKVEALNKDATQPVDARVSYDEEGHSYRIEDEKIGTAIDEAPVLEAASEAVSTLKAEVKVDASDLLQPKVTREDPTLVAAADKANDTLEATQTLTIQDEDVYTVDAERIAAWVSLDDDLQLQVDEDACREWAQGELSDQLDTLGKTHSYTRPDGKEVTVTGGEYGWNLNGEELAHLICENLRSGSAETIEVPMLDTAYRYAPGGQEWPDRYIDIDLSEQHVRFYDGGDIIWESDCVSGNTSTGHGTPEGVYTLNAKSYGSVRLEGRDDPNTGQPEYVSYVTYWMPFVNDAVALHDADWRYNFGGTIYQYDGSHGCVNLPPENAAALYDICSEGDVVITHW